MPDDIVLCPECLGPIDYGDNYVCNDCWRMAGQRLPPGRRAAAAAVPLVQAEARAELVTYLATGGTLPRRRTATAPQTPDPEAVAVKCEVCEDAINPAARLDRTKACRLCKHSRDIDVHLKCCQNSHWICVSCHRPQSAVAEVCHVCNGCAPEGESGRNYFGFCCQCSECDGGDSEESHRFNGDGCPNDDCSQCSDHCTCRGSRIRFFNMPLKKHFAEPRTGFRQNPFQRLIGVEIEVATVEDFQPVETAVRRWSGSVVHDGSVSDSEGNEGFEINSAPASGDRFIEQVNEVCGALRENSGYANETCGVHVHVDAEDLSWWDIRKLIRVYAKVEPALFGIIDQGRRKNQYCVPCGDRLVVGLEKPSLMKTLKENILLKVYGRESGKGLKSAQSAKWADSRYNALNLHSWFYRGTVEFRHHHGTTRASKVRNWALVCASIVDGASRMTDSQVEALPSGVRGLLALAKTDETRSWVVARWNKFNPTKKVNPDGSPDGWSEETAATPAPATAPGKVGNEDTQPAVVCSTCGDPSCDVRPVRPRAGRSV